MADFHFVPTPSQGRSGATSLAASRTRKWNASKPFSDATFECQLRRGGGVFERRTKSRFGQKHFAGDHKDSHERFGGRAVRREFVRAVSAVVASVAYSRRVHAPVVRAVKLV